MTLLSGSTTVLTSGFSTLPRAFSSTNRCRAQRVRDAAQTIAQRASQRASHDSPVNHDASRFVVAEPVNHLVETIFINTMGTAGSQALVSPHVGGSSDPICFFPMQFASVFGGHPSFLLPRTSAFGARSER